MEEDQEIPPVKRILQQLGLIAFTYFASAAFWLAAGSLLLADACRRGMAGHNAAGLPELSA